MVPNTVSDKLTFQSIKPQGRAAKIIFSGETRPDKRLQQNVSNTELIIPEVMEAIKMVFPVCKSINGKILRSMAGDVPQALHRDHAPTASTKAIKSLSSYHYSAVISFEDDTRLIIGEKEIDIQRFSMLFYRGDMDHAGAGYTKCNGRLFLSISSKSFPVS